MVTDDNFDQNLLCIIKYQIIIDYSLIIDYDLPTFLIENEFLEISKIFKKF